MVPAGGRIDFVKECGSISFFCVKSIEVIVLRNQMFIVLRNQLANTTEQAGIVLSSKTVHGEIEKRA